MKQPPPFRRPLVPPPPFNRERRSGSDRRDPNGVEQARQIALDQLRFPLATLKRYGSVYKDQIRSLEEFMADLKEKTVPTNRIGLDRRRKAA